MTGYILNGEIVTKDKVIDLSPYAIIKSSLYTSFGFDKIFYPNCDLFTADFFEVYELHPNKNQNALQK